MPDNLGLHEGPRGPTPRGHITVSRPPFSIRSLHSRLIILVKVMLKLSTAMLLTATLHFSVAFYRGWLAFGGKTTEPQAPELLWATLGSWHRVLEDMLFIAQESLGAGAAVRYMYLNSEMLL